MTTTQFNNYCDNYQKSLDTKIDALPNGGSLVITPIDPKNPNSRCEVWKNGKGTKLSFVRFTPLVGEGYQMSVYHEVTLHPR